MAMRNECAHSRIIALLVSRILWCFLIPLASSLVALDGVTWFENDLRIALMKIRLLLCVNCYWIFLLLLSSCARGPSLDAIEKTKHERFDSFASAQMQFAYSDHPVSQRTMGRYPAWMQWYLNDLMGWNPLGRSLLRSQRCESKAASWTNFEAVSDYFTDCEEVIKNDSLLANLQGLLTMTIDMRLDLHPFFQRVLFKLPGGVQLKGYLGLKDTTKSRPLVVLRSGVFANVEEARAEMYLLIQLFEQSHFNFLIVENMSGPDFVHNNTKFGFGGYDEGLQNLWLARLLKDQNQPIHRLVDSLHFVGVSLGGHGVFFASFLNELNNKPIDSFLGICPLIQMPVTINHLIELPGYEGMLVNYWSSMRLAELKANFTNAEKGADQHGDRNNDPRSMMLSPTLAQTLDLIERKYSGAMSGVEGVHLPFGLTDGKEFLAQNDFTALALKQMQEGRVVPQSSMLVLGTDVDLLVPYSMNAGWLKKQKAKGAFPQVTVQRMKYGNHCSFPDAYQWRPMASLLQSFVARYSSQFRLVNKEMSQTFETNDLFEDEDVSQGRLYIEWNQEKQNFWIRYQFFVRGRPYNLDFELPRAALDMQFPDSKRLTRYEERMAIRWLYHNLSVKFTSDDEVMMAHLQWAIAP